jgi:hypothetical protein
MASLVEKQINNFIEETWRVTGVRHVVVCDRHGISLGAHSELLEDSVLLDRVGILILQILGTIDKRSSKSIDVEAQFEHGAIVVRDLGNAFAVIVCSPKINWSLLRIALNVSVTKFTQDAQLQKALAQRISFSDVLQVLDVFTNELIDELGDRGIGRANLVERLLPTIGKLKLQYPSFSELGITHRGIDFSSLYQSSAVPREIIRAWGDLMMAICSSVIADMGEPNVVKKYRQVAIKNYRQNKKVFQDMDLESVIPAIELPIGF